MQTKNINVSDRVENQLPEFIRQEDRQLVNFLFEYYKSQEKTGRPYDILNNLLITLILIVIALKLYQALRYCLVKLVLSIQR